MLLVAAGAYVFRPRTPATRGFSHPWQGYVDNDFQLVQDEGDNRHVTYLVGDRGAFWVLDYIVDRDKFGAFAELLERSADSFRILVRG